MFNTTHDAILLFLAIVYLIVFVMRGHEVTTLRAASKGRVQVPPGYAWVPLAVASILFAVAVIW